jgi:chorismate-pyruvate lyase
MDEKACAENKRSPQTAQTPSPMGRIVFRHTWQTGSPEISTSGSPHTRQSDGKRTAKRLPASRSAIRRKGDLGISEAKKGPAAAALA